LECGHHVRDERVRAHLFFRPDFIVSKSKSLQLQGLEFALKLSNLGTRQPVGNINDHVETVSTVFTDDHGGYRNMSDKYTHEIIIHAVEYVGDHVHTNSIENFGAS